MNPYTYLLALAFFFFFFFLTPTHAMRNIINPKKSHAGEKCRHEDMSDCSWYKDRWQ